MPSPNRVSSLATLTCALAIASGSLANGASERDSVLRLQDGSYLAGRWQAGDHAEALLWRPDFAEGIYRFPWSEVSQVVQPRADGPSTPSGRYRFELMDGDNLRGDLVRVDPQWLTISVTLDEPTELRLRRASVRRLVSLRGRGELVYQGPDAPDAWTAESPEDWRLEAGALATTAERASIYRDIELPERFVVELELAWEPGSDFEMQLAVPEEAAPIEDEKMQRRRQMRRQPPLLAPVGGYALRTVGGVLVVTRELKKTADIQPLMELPKGKGSFSCLLFGDQRTGRLLVTTPQGKTLTEITVADPQAEVQSGIRLTNHRGASV